MCIKGYFMAKNSFVVEATFENCSFWSIPVDNNMFKVNNTNTRKRCEICSQLTIKDTRMTPDIVLFSLLLTLNIFHTLF